MEDLDSERDILGQPLVNQPGETWEYGVSMDWVGRLIEQASGFPLDQYFEKFIFAPLQLSETSFFPSPGMKSKLASLHQRNPDGTINLRENGHLLRRPLLATTVEQRELTMKSGGAGLFSTPTEYCGKSTAVYSVPRPNEKFIVLTWTYLRNNCYPSESWYPRKNKKSASQGGNGTR